MVQVTTKAKHKKETYAIIIGIISLISSFYFFLIKLGAIKHVFSLPDTFFLYFFAILALISGIIHFSQTIGVIETD